MTKAGDYQGVKAVVAEVPAHDRVAFINQQDENGITALAWCFPHPEENVIRTMFTADDTFKPQASDVSDGQVKIAEFLCHYGADVNLGNMARDTPLHCACRCDHRDLITLFIQHGGDKGISNDSGNKPEQAQINDSTKAIVNQIMSEELLRIKALVSQKKWIAWKPEETSFCRSLFDTLDVQGLDFLRFADFSTLLTSEDKDDESKVTGPKPEDLLKFFSNMNTNLTNPEQNFNGMIKFHDFRRHVMQWIVKVANVDKGGKGGKKKKKKKKKKKG